MEEKKESTKKVENKNISLNESIIKIRVKLQSSNLKKSGKNKFAGFEYFELADFLPKLNELMEEEGINDIFTINENVAKLTLIKGEESQEYTLPFYRFNTPLNKNGGQSMQDIQYLGALNTYYKRYLYLNAFGITDGEVIDRMNNEDLGRNQSIKKLTKLVNEAQLEKLKKLSEDAIKFILNDANVEKLEELEFNEASTYIKSAEMRGLI